MSVVTHLSFGASIVAVQISATIAKFALSLAALSVTVASLLFLNGDILGFADRPAGALGKLSDFGADNVGMPPFPVSVTPGLVPL